MLSEGATSVKVYFPGKDSKTLWYDTDSYQAYPGNGYTTIDVNIAKVGDMNYRVMTAQLRKCLRNFTGVMCSNLIVL